MLATHGSQLVWYLLFNSGTIPLRIMLQEKLAENVLLLFFTKTLCNAQVSD